MSSENYEEAKLREVSFRDRDLGHAQFRGADITGADFTGADLQGADLRNVHTGMPPRWKLLVVALGLAVSILIGVMAGLIGRFVTALLKTGATAQSIAGVLLTAMLLVFAVAAIWRGFVYAMKNTLPPFAAVLLVSAAVGAAIGPAKGTLALGTLGLLVALALAIGLGGAARLLAGTTGRAGFIVAALAGALVSTLALGGGVLATIVAIAAVLLGQLALQNREGLGPVTRAAIGFGARGGTRFRDADLRGARFEGAELRACDFRGAKLDEGAFQDAAEVTSCVFDTEDGTALPEKPRRAWLSRRRRAAPPSAG